MARKVLIIEDRRENIVFIANNILKPEGWEVLTARDGELGLQRAIEEKPDLIITDLKLPKMHGLDVLEALRKRGLNIPTIVMTFHGSEETAIRAFRLGAIDYLIKPFEIEEMMDAIERGLKGSPTAQPDPAIAEKLASQEREIQQLRSLLQQQARAMQEHQPTPPPRAETADATRWQALVKERDSALAALKKQTISQHRAMNRQISELQAELAEKDAILANLQTQIRQAGSDSNTGSEGAGPSPDANEREHAREEAGRLIESLTQTLAVHQQAIEKHREEAERLAQELHVLAAALQVLGQSLSDQAQQMSHMGLRED